MTTRPGRAALCAAAALALGPGLGGLARAENPSATNPLADYAWSARPLLIIAEDAAAAGLSAQIAGFDDRRADLADRAMPLIVVVGDAVTVDGTPSDLSADRLRAHVRAPAQGVTVALFGKDTGLKFRDAAPVAPDAVFALIDRMPMRRREMRERP